MPDLVVGKVTVPDPTGEDLQGYLDLLDDNELIGHVVFTPNAKTYGGFVISVSPTGDVDPGTTIQVVCSSGVPVSTPSEGLELIAKRVFIDGGHYTLIAYCNAQGTLGLDTVLADLVQPDQTNGYAPILLDGTWVGPKGVATYTHSAGATNDGAGNPCFYLTGHLSAPATGVALISVPDGKIQHFSDLKDGGGALTTFDWSASSPKLAVSISELAGN